MKKILKSACLITALFLVTATKAQLSGTYNVPSTFTSVAAAISSLNVAGVSGAVTIEINAGYTETVTAGGFSLGVISGASAANTIVFQKTGPGANPMLVAYAGGTAVPTSGIQDGVWRFVGTDFVTVDGIDISDPNASNPATMEYGYGFFKASATDGCQNNTIMNCHITLNRLNNDAGDLPAMDGSRGIDVVNAMANTHTTAVTVTAASGANSNNKFYSNTIENCNYGIAMIGFADSTPFALTDSGNDIGGTSALTGNTIINFGGGGTDAPAAGIRTQAQYGVNISYNTINNNNGSGVNHEQDLRGIHLATAQSANATITNNTVTVGSGGLSGELLVGIQNASGSTAASNSVIITNNVIANCTYTGAVDATFYGIYSSASAAYLSISNNTLSNNSTDDQGYGTFYDIYNSGAVTTTIDINNNTVDIGTFNASYCSINVAGIRNTAGSNASILNINDNILQNANFAGSGTDDEVNLIINTGRRGTANINGNNFNNLDISSDNDVYLISNSSTTRNTNTNNNVITTGFTASTSYNVFGYYNAGGPGTGTATVNGNNFSNISLPNASAFFGVYHYASTSQVVNVNNNLISNVTTAGGIECILHASGGAGSTVSGNTLTAFTADYIYGLEIGYSDDLQIAGNTISSFTSTGSSGEAIGIGYFDGPLTTITKNKIYDIASDGTDGLVCGIYTLGGSTLTISNNLVGDLKAPTGNGQVVAGIIADGMTNVNIYYNTVNIDGTSSGTDFSIVDLFASDVPVLDLRNNILVNTATPTGTGAAYAYMRNSTNLTNYAITSNNNLFYAGTPSANNLIYYDGTNSVQTLSAYKLLTGLRDAASVTENPPFASVIGSSANYLELNTTTPTQAESGGLPVAGLTDDYAGTTRDVTTPDMGAWEGSYSIILCSTPLGGTLAVSAVTTCIGETVVAVSNSVSTGVGTTYLWKVGTTAGGPYAPVTGGTGSTIPTYTSDPLPAGVYYVVLETTCASTTLSALSNEGTLTVNTPPTATAAVTSGTAVCAGQNVNLAGSGSATTFSWTGPNGYTSSTQNPVLSAADVSLTGTYSLVVSDLCPSAPATVAVVIYPYPQTPTITPSSASICPGGSQTITAIAIGASAPLLDFGTQANQNDGVTGSRYYPAPYTAYYGGQRMQMLILASELYAFGFVAGSSITSVQFPVVSLAGDWGSAITENQDFQVNIGMTNLSSISNFEPGLTNVVAPMNFTPTVGYNNTHTFASPFIWDGSSNLILETSFSNNVFGTAAFVVTQYNSPTSFQSTIVYREDSQPSTAIATNTNISFSYSARPDFKLNGTAIGTSSWSPATGLSATTGFSVIASPAVATVYTLTASLGACATTETVSIGITPTPVLNIVTTATAVCAGDAATLTASGADTYSWNPTNATSTISVNPASTTVYTVSGQNQNCAVVTETIEIVSNPLPAVTASASSATLCAGETTTLTGGGANTYVWVSGPTTDTYAVNPASNLTYSVTGTDANGCSADAMVSVTVNTLPSLTVAPLTATVCMSSSATFTATGASTYSWTSGGTSATETIVAAASGIYTVTGTSTAGCSSTETVALTALALPSLTVAPVNASVCMSSSATFTATGASTYSWTSGSASSTETIVAAASGIYTVTGTTAGCSSTETVALTALALPVLTVTPASPTICAGESAVLEGSGAANYAWMPGTATTSTLEVNPSATASYTIEGTDANSCKNTKVVTVTVNDCTGLGKESQLSGNVNLYPNPSTGLITANFGFEGTKEIVVLNSVGSLILQTSTMETSTSFDLSGFAKGVYFVNVRSNGATANYKIVIQ